jgi:toxin ParE1/3/4
MARIVITASADADLAEIIAYLREHAADTVAQKYATEFDAIYDRLVDFPGSGPRRTALGPDTRIVIVPPYVMIYDYADDTVTILRVVHGKRDITARLLTRH